MPVSRSVPLPSSSRSGYLVVASVSGSTRSRTGTTSLAMTASPFGPSANSGTQPAGFSEICQPGSGTRSTRPGTSGS
jgi:hypothetical protein